MTENAVRRRPPGPLRLGRSEFAPDRTLVMAIVNRTPDSFYRPGLTWDFKVALDHVAEAVEQGADLVDVGGVPAKPGEVITVTEELRRVVDFIAAIRAAYPRLVISVDTWRHEVGAAACEAGAAGRRSRSPVPRARGRPFTRRGPREHGVRDGQPARVKRPGRRPLVHRDGPGPLPHLAPGPDA